jgi:hypothetical protein
MNQPAPVQLPNLVVDVYDAMRPPILPPDWWRKYSSVTWVYHPIICGQAAASLPQPRPQTCTRCDGDGKAHGSDRPFEWRGPGSYAGECPVCHGSGVLPDAVSNDGPSVRQTRADAAL